MKSFVPPSPHPFLGPTVVRSVSVSVSVDDRRRKMMDRAVRSRLSRIVALLIAAGCASFGGDARYGAIGIIFILIFSEILGVVAELPGL